MPVRCRQTGSALAEFGPALCLLVLGLLFPFLDLICLGLKYFDCVTLNDLQARKAALVSRSSAEDQAGPVKGELTSAWSNSGMGAFVRLAQAPQTEVSYNVSDPSAIKVLVSTTFAIQPFINIPFAPVPGLGTTATITISSKRLLEDPLNYGR